MSKPLEDSLLLENGITPLTSSQTPQVLSIAKFTPCHDTRTALLTNSFMNNERAIISALLSLPMLPHFSSLGKRTETYDQFKTIES